MVTTNPVDTAIGARKDDHVRYAVAQHQQRTADPVAGAFDDIGFVHHALAGVDTESVSLATGFAGVRWPVPLYINAMTGGSARTGEINRGLAIAARETGVAIATGSMSAYLKDPGVAHTYRVIRQENPGGFIFANVNANTTPDQARRAVDLLGADALQIHINAVQETVMPEGDRDFSPWPGNIARLAAELDIPVVVKEVGFGLSGDTLRLIARLGVHAADVSGSGGTNFAVIENNRRDGNDFGYLAGWGQSAAAGLLEGAAATPLPLLASGGVRNPLDVIKALALGARAVGASGQFLAVLDARGVPGLIALINDWLEQIRQLMALLGATEISDLTRTDLLIRGTLAEYCALRRIDIVHLANRRGRSEPTVAGWRPARCSAQHLDSTDR